MEPTNEPQKWPPLECRCLLGHLCDPVTKKHLFLSEKIVCFIGSWLLFILIEFWLIFVIVVVSCTDQGTLADRLLIISSCTLLTLSDFYLLYHEWKEL